MQREINLTDKMLTGEPNKRLMRLTPEADSTDPAALVVMFLGVAGLLLLALLAR